MADAGKEQSEARLPEERVGAAMRAAREAAGISLRQMAERLGHGSHSTLSSYERGHLMPSDDAIDGYEAELGLNGALRSALEGARVERHGDAFARRRPPIGPTKAVTPEPPAPDPTTSQTPTPPRRRKWRAMNSAVAALCLASATGGFSYWHFSRNIVSHPVSDNADPQNTGCARLPGVEVLDTAEVDYGNEPAGVVQLKYSPECGAAWPRFQPNKVTNIPAQTIVHIDIVRPDDQNARFLFDAKFKGEAVYGNVAVSTSKCVYAAVWIEGSGQNKDTESHTHCFRGSTYVR